MKIFLVRHGQPDMVNNGAIKARDLGEWIQRYNQSGVRHCKTIICSDLPRTTKSARLLVLTEPTHIDPLFREMGLPFSNWVEQSNSHAQQLLDLMATYNPEHASGLGVEGYDDQIIDLKPALHQYLLPYHHLALDIYIGFKQLLDKKVSADRYPAALLRLQKYTGSSERPGTAAARVAA